MKTTRKLAIVLILAFSVILLTACGSDSNDTSKKKGFKNPDIVIPTAVPTSTPTPTEVPKTPEQKDQDAILSIMETAEKYAAKKKYTFEDTTSFQINFNDGKIELEIDPIKTYQMRLRDDWINNSPSGKREYTLQSEKYGNTCRYANIIGVIENDGTVSWTANNIDKDVFAAISGHDVTWAAEYLHRAELYEEIKGTWSGEVQWPFDVLIDLFVDMNDPGAVQAFHNLIDLLKKSGFSGKLKMNIECSFLSEKELSLTLGIDWSEFLESVKKTTSTEKGMTKYLCTITDVDELSLKYILQEYGTDVMTYGNSTVAMLEYSCNQNTSNTSYSPFTVKDNVLTITEATRNVDRLTYDKEKRTLTYRDVGMTCVMTQK
ncbi:MAG: hypothetical protein J6Y20_03335 [Lachnospiraceae bacterium]|nr:hypothetical protein [Lachnospiraceae bacterium]